MKDSAEKVKEALQEARKAQTAATSAIQQASADMNSTYSLLSSVSTHAQPGNSGRNTGGNFSSRCCLQVESETADAELKLNNATQRLQQLEQDVMQLRDKAQNVSQSREQIDRDANSVRKVAEEVKKVSGRVQEVRPHWCAHTSPNRVPFFRSSTLR